MAQFLLLHSPLVGPRTLSPLAVALDRLGHSAAVPNLRPAISESGFSSTILRTIVAQAVAEMPQPVPLVLAVHSGASAYLPVLAPHMDLAGQVLLDAVLPPSKGTFTPSWDFRSELDRLVEADQRLPPWPQWWGDEHLARVVPDPDLRAAISRECPRVPISFYDSVIDVPPDWALPWAGYLRLSEGYEPQATLAGERGWPVRRRTGGHLDTATQPDEVAADLIYLVRPVLDTESKP